MARKYVLVEWTVDFLMNKKESWIWELIGIKVWWLWDAGASDVYGGLQIDGGGGLGEMRKNNKSLTEDIQDLQHTPASPILQNLQKVIANMIS